MTSVPVILVTFPLGGHRPVPRNCITQVPGLRAGRWVTGHLSRSRVPGDLRQEGNVLY